MGGILLVISMAGLVYIIYWVLQKRDGNLNGSTESFLEMKKEPFDSEEESNGDSQT